MRISWITAPLLFVLTSPSMVRSDSTASPLPFTPMGISRTGQILTVCGTDRGIAFSSDGGDHWDVRHKKAGAETLLAIGWRSDNTFGFTGGTGGIVLVTVDSGTTWKQVPTNFQDPILQLSFADPQHGVVATTDAVLYTRNGGETWQSIIPSNSVDVGGFKYVLEVAALDSSHAAVLLKVGAAQYFDGRIVTTGDEGTTWKIKEMEHTTLNNLLVVDNEYWLVGTEVIDRGNHGGHAVSVTFHSSDGDHWVRGPKPLIDVNNACRPEGCLMWNGAGFNPFSARGNIIVFQTISNLSAQWSATDARICSLVPELQCAEVKNSKVLPERGTAAPFLAATLLRPTTPDLAGKCIRCDYPPVLISHKFGGKAMVDLAIYARADGTVSSVEVANAPSDDVRSDLERAAREWFFYPVLKNGIPTPTKRNIKLTVNVIKRD